MIKYFTHVIKIGIMMGIPCPPILPEVPRDADEVKVYSRGRKINRRNTNILKVQCVPVRISTGVLVHGT